MQCALGPPGADGPDRITYNTYDAAGRLKTVTKACGTSLATTVESYQYTPDGLKQSVTDANNNVTNYAYDGFDRLSVTTYPTPAASGSVTTEMLGYDSNSNVTSDTRRDGTVVYKTYDALNRLTSISNPASSYAYDNLDRLTSSSRTSSSGSVIALTYAYDALGRQICEATSSCSAGWTSGSAATCTLPQNGIPSGAFLYCYDAKRHLTQIAWPDPFVVDYIWDFDDEVTQIQEGPSNGGMVLATYGYNDLGLRVSLARGSGVNTTYGYDPFWRLSSVAHAFPSAYANDNETISLTRNEDSQIITRSTTNALYDWSVGPAATTSYAVNALNQVTTGGCGGVGSQRWHFDFDRNRWWGRFRGRRSCRYCHSEMG